MAGEQLWLPHDLRVPALAVQLSHIPDSWELSFLVLLQEETPAMSLRHPSCWAIMRQCRVGVMNRGSWGQPA